MPCRRAEAREAFDFLALRALEEAAFREEVRECLRDLCLVALAPRPALLFAAVVLWCLRDLKTTGFTIRDDLLLPEALLARLWDRCAVALAFRVALLRVEEAP